MYIIIKIFNKKLTSSYEKPLLKLEVNGDNAIQTLIYHILKKFYNNDIAEKVKEIMKGD